MMKFGVFAYNFPHWKTQQGLFALAAAGLCPEVVIGQNFKKLNITGSQIRTTPHDQLLFEPEDVCKALGFRYVNHDHDDLGSREEIYRRQLDIGIILGARILHRDTIEAFKTGIINMHPGSLPDNRGLDNIKWAIINGIKQYVTVHYINENIDAGWQIIREIVPVYFDDSLIEINMRMIDVELKLMTKVLKEFKRDGIKNKDRCDDLPEDVKCFSTMPPEVEKNLEVEFFNYKEAHCAKS